MHTRVHFVNIYLFYKFYAFRTRYTTKVYKIIICPPKLAFVGSARGGRLRIMGVTTYRDTSMRHVETVLSLDRYVHFIFGVTSF
jgi:hypothetical protein